MKKEMINFAAVLLTVLTLVGCSENEDYSTWVRVTYNISSPGDAKILANEFDISEISKIAIVGASGQPESVKPSKTHTFDVSGEQTVYIKFKNANKVPNMAFTECRSLTSAYIPSGITEVGDMAFTSCAALRNVALPNSLKKIADWAFSGCERLESVSIPNSVTEIGGRAFGACSGLIEVSIGSGVQKIGDFAFAYCSQLNRIYALPSNPPSFGEDAFERISSSGTLYSPNIENYSKWTYLLGWRGRLHEE